VSGRSHQQKNSVKVKMFKMFELNCSYNECASETDSARKMKIKMKIERFLGYAQKRWFTLQTY
jgi:hypothetical protein